MPHRFPCLADETRAGVGVKTGAPVPIKTKDIDYPGLLQDIKTDRMSMQRFRQERYDMVQEYAGNHWSDEGATHKIPLNLLSLYVGVVGRNLIAKNPRYMLSTFSPNHKPTVAAMQAWANKEVEHMGLANTLQRVVVDALFSVGICKVALASPANSASVAWSLAAGEPFAERVDLDDFVFDVHARDFSQVGYIGHRYRVPIDVVKDSKMYGKGRKSIEPMVEDMYNIEGDPRIDLLGRGTYSNAGNRFEKYVDLWEIYLPRHRLIVTFVDNQMVGAEGSADMNGEVEPLRVQGWVGPDMGPYHILGFGVVPGNAMPKAPIQDLLDLHHATNNAYRKVLRMTERIKELTLVAGGAEADGNSVMNGSDGDILAVRDPSKVVPFVSGGSAVNVVMTMAQAFKDLFSFMGGNLELMGGRGAQSKTATQDKLLNENAGASIADMQDRTVQFASKVGNALCWYWWNDPFKVQKSKHSLQGLPEFEIVRQVFPGQHPDPNALKRDGKYEDLQIEVDPYSMQHATPQSRLQGLMTAVQQIYLPMATIAQQQGVAFDFNAFFKMIGQYMDQPDLTSIFTIQEPPAQEQIASGGGHGEAGPGPAQTTRNYVRESMPGRTRQGDEMNQRNAMMGINPGGNPLTTANGKPSMNGVRK